MKDIRTWLGIGAAVLVIVFYLIFDHQSVYKPIDLTKYCIVKDDTVTKDPALKKELDPYNEVDKEWYDSLKYTVIKKSGNTLTIKVSYDKECEEQMFYDFEPDDSDTFTMQTD
ncbi:hypothetical protein [Catenisphaera adipataccumulans]|jgi:hypothetical protein|uniref:Uncharacterized protein n=1 Tax=Catenisphaera adipataccumulans TaxID=700500 RepID=A0A7W8CWY2_9FIRM|nr:hypothetical protein [Catenisphaera adipataccumulans]MBB5182474.1 hypothetical protein [Catenisphaera adipataccumulans]